MDEIANIVLFVLGYKGYQDIKKGYLDWMLHAAVCDRMNDYHVVYLDNASRDGTIEHLLLKYPQIDVLLSPENYLYDKSVNLGLQYIYRHYNPDYYLLVDIDNPCQENCYYELARYAREHPETGIVQPQVRGLENREVLYSCGHHFIENYGCRPLTVLPEDLRKLDDQESVSFSSTLIKREVFLQCGILDEVFRMYYESSDLSFRAREQEFRLGCAVKAISYNNGTDTFDVNNYHQAYFFHRNRLIFWRKHDLSIYGGLLKEYQGLIADFQEKYGRGLQAKPLECVTEHAKFKASVDAVAITQDKERWLKAEKRIEDYSNLDLVLLQKGGGL